MGEVMTATTMRLVLAEPFEAGAVGKLRAIGEVVILESWDETRLCEAVAECEALLVRTRAVVTRKVIESARRLRVIGRGGVGLDNIDLAAAQERGVVVVYTPGAATDAAADLTVGLLIALVRGLRAGDAGVREGRFYEARERAVAGELGELTLGIIGMGRIGQAVARRCRHGFHMKVVYNDVVSPGWLDVAAMPLSKDEVYRAADVVSLHVPLDETTREMVDGAALAKFRPGAFLINTARGGVVDQVALAKALVEGRLGGAALDVFDPEPPPVDHPLLSAPNTLFTPHIAARSTGGLARMNDVVDDVIRVLQGKKPLYPAWTP